MFAGLNPETRMRRTLFTTGIPRKVLSADSLVTVFDTTDFTPQEGAPQVFAVTLFAWAYQNIVPIADPTEHPLLLLTVTTDGGSAVVVNQRFPSDFAAGEEAAETGTAQPALLLERFMMRGDQQLIIANLNETSTSCFVYGYFEQVGAAGFISQFRPLQPGQLLAPFSAAPTLVTVAANAPGAYATAHQLSSAYVDAVTLKANVGSTATEVADATAFVRLPGGVKIPLPFNNAGDADAHYLLLSEPFDGIPMIAPSTNTGANLIEVGFDAGSTTAGVAVSAYGSFRRPG